jgi:hypothetical protein
MKLAKLLAGLGLTATVLFAYPIVSQASSILVDQGSSTLDPATHLQWLDLTLTQGLGADDVQGNVGVSYVADGWRYATAPEVAQLWNDAGFIYGSYGGAGNPPVPPEIGAFQNLTGVTEQHLGGDGYNYYSGGLFLYSVNETRSGVIFDYGVADIQRYSSDTGEPLAQASILPLGLPAEETASSRWGSYLVRTVPVAAVPLPASLPMFAAAIGLLGLAGWHRRSQHLPLVTI